MRILVVGSGGREHALVARLAAEPDTPEIICAPGNPGIGKIARLISAPAAAPEELVALAASEHVDLTVVGPELPLSLGVADRFAQAGRLLFGPSRAAAALESSKAFAKGFMARHGIPTARFQTCETPDEAYDVVRSSEFGFPVVLKADGLAAGKGVVVANDVGSAEAAIVAAMLERRFGAAGDRLVIEECLSGPELSFFVIADGHRAILFGSAQDHKRAYDDDCGPNTGGMGAFAPSPLAHTIHARIMSEIIEPLIAGMAEEGHPFRGFLYAGLMVTADGPKVIEFNVRLGDPEAQVIMPLVEEPLVPVLIASATGNLKPSSLRLTSDRTVGVVLASRGYPESSESGQRINGIEEAERVPGVTVYQAGTSRRDSQLMTAGGRVLTVVGRAGDFREAVERAYAGVSLISFDGMHYRRDIGRKVLEQQLSR